MEPVAEKRRQFIRFCINGAAAVAIQYGVYLLMLEYTGAFMANTVAYAVSFCYNFIMTSYWTFGRKPTFGKLAGFCGSHIVNYIAQQIFLCLALWLSIPDAYAALVAMACAVPVNFTILRLVYTRR